MSPCTPGPCPSGPRVRGCRALMWRSRRLLPLAAAALLAAPGPARAQTAPSFAQLAGPAGCLLQTGVDPEDLELDTTPTDCGRAGGLASARTAVLSPDQKHVYVVAGGSSLSGS